ncbi:MAG: acetolactate synthase large subunit, partial [Pseudomonadota bacterium]
MNGAESLLKSLVNGGVEVCFTNPGTSEMQFVAAVDRVEGMRTVLCLFEGVCSAAADGYARMAGKPACTLLHLGPGLSNASANLHNARRAKTPLINIIGDHATYHRQYDAPLNSDIESLSRPVSGWVKNVISSHTIASDAAASIVAAMTPPGQISTLIVPADCSWDEAGHPAAAPEMPTRRRVTDEAVDEVAKALLSGEPSVMLMNGAALSAEAAELASRIAEHTGARVMSDTFYPRHERGAGRAVIGRLPYFAEAAAGTLDGCRHLILVGTTPPVSFFAYPNKPSWLTPEDSG